MSSCSAGSAFSAGLGVTWRNIVLGQRDNPLGMGYTVPLGTVPLVIIGVVVVKLVRFHSSIEAISMKLGGHIGHGPNSSYHHF